MSTSKKLDRICAIAAALSLVLTVLFMNSAAFGVQAADKAMGYETRLFDTSRVHTLDLVVDGWESFLDGCEDEEYIACAAVIDGESFKNVALRAKGNTSLSSVKSMDSNRYSFKLEFDHYNKNETYHGLDKLCLNNIIQDTTYMKDYLTYRLMAEFGADAPLCSYVFITVNGEDWGLYLAVEGVEDSFLQRNYGSDAGDLYKPDSMNMGGGRGNGRAFNMDDILQDLFGEDVDVSALSEDEIRNKLDEARSSGGFRGGRPGGGFSRGEAPTGASLPEGAAIPESGEASENGEASKGFGGGPGGGGMGSSDVKLNYIDDDPDSYSAIFDSAKTTVTEADKARLIASLKQLSDQEAPDEVLDVDEVLRYFVVHNFVVNGDSYTGSMIHNYYLHEKDGKFSMIPWDYNLAFGSFQGGDSFSAVNDPIDTPLSVGSGDSRAMADWIFASEEYTEQYHALFSDFLEQFDLQAMIGDTAELIAPYVERDPSKFYSYEDFETGVEALKLFCALRSESVRGQLDGTIPSTDEGQAADSSALVDSSALSTSDLGSMNMGGGPGGGGPGGGGPGGGLPGDGGPDGFPGGDNSGKGGFPDGKSSDMPDGFGPVDGVQSASVSSDSLLMLGVCLAVLLAGVALAWRFRAAR